jgi:hypothetical protein
MPQPPDEPEGGSTLTAWVLGTVYANDPDMAETDTDGIEFGSAAEWHWYRKGFRDRRAELDRQ